MKAVLCRGLPGSGKSTYARKLAKEEGYEHFENDMYFMKDGKYMFDDFKMKDAADWCFSSFLNALKAKKNVVVSNVFVTRSAVDRYLKAAKKLGAEVEVIRFTGDFGNKHDVPLYVLSSMKKSFQDYPGEIVYRY